MDELEQAARTILTTVNINPDPDDMDIVMQPDLHREEYLRVKGISVDDVALDGAVHTRLIFRP